MNRLISYPRSGNHWVRFIIEYLSNRPTIYIVPGKDTPIYKNTFIYNGKEVASPIDIKNKQTVFYKQHDVLPFSINGNMAPEIIDTDKIILIIRSPKEAIIRHNYNTLLPGIKAGAKRAVPGSISMESAHGMISLPISIDTDEPVNIDRLKNMINNNCAIEFASTPHNRKIIKSFLSISDIDYYFRLIDFYDKFKGAKLLIRYNKLINNCESVATDINNFLEIKNEKYLNKFIENKEYFSEISRRAKNRQWIGSVSESDLNYHAKTVQEEFPNINLNYFDEYALTNYKYLIKKYNIEF